MPSPKKAPSWRPPSKRTSFQNSKKRRPAAAHSDAESPRGERRPAATRSQSDAPRSERRSSENFDRRPAGQRDGAPSRGGDTRSYDKSDRRSAPSGERRSSESYDRRPAGQREGAPSRGGESRSYQKSDRRPTGSGERRQFSGDDRRPPRDGARREPHRGDRSYDAPRKQIPTVHHKPLEAIAVAPDAGEGLEFQDLGLGDRIAEAIREQGAITPFALQAVTIPVALTGRHVLGRGRTGSGKTIAFSAPLVERLLRLTSKGVKRAVGRAPRALILAPTRELALQIDRTVQPIARSVGLFTTQIYGGVPLGRQIGALERGVDIVVGTPGRIEDLMARGKLDVSQVVISVVDEADHMSELGFIEPLGRILRETSPSGQRLLFSATLDAGVAGIVAEFLPDPAVFEVAGENQESSTIDHRVWVVDQRQKRDVVLELAQGPGKTLMFTRTRAFAEELADHLDDHGVPAVSLHGDLNQARRTRNLEKLTSGRVNVLVATDVAARGIHVDDIDTVVQVDQPDDFKSYVHRSGRTGRAGKEGRVITLTTRSRSRKLVDLLKQAGISCELEEKSAKPSRPLERV